MVMPTFHPEITLPPMEKSCNCFDNDKVNCTWYCCTKRAKSPSPTSKEHKEDCELEKVKSISKTLTEKKDRNDK